MQIQKRKCNFKVIILEKKQSNVDMMIKLIMQRVYVIIAIINTEEQKSRGTVHMRNFTQAECVKIATSTCIIKRKESKTNQHSKNKSF